MFNNKLNNNLYSFKFQVSFLGDEGSGKTSALRKIFNKEIPVSPTIGVDYDSKILLYKNKKIKLSVWDLSGADRFRPILKNYYNGNNIIVLFLDLTKDVTKSFKYWINEINTNIKEKIPILIILNKSDMVETFNTTFIFNEATNKLNKFNIIFHNINIDKYSKNFIEKKILSLLLDDLIDIDLYDKFKPQQKSIKKRELCFTSFFKFLWK
tara:strand:- start:4267 stop:4896 length:630 start_codon:yes stop_codon:yes gene_type:complete